ncbi:MAG: hypothetical protein ISS82_05600, partial [Nanoarchaeota archaeon]|nr:hypothetical protein [Nanoarchaeota archaeon]
CGIPGDPCSGIGASTCCQPEGYIPPTNPTYPLEQYCSYGKYDNQLTEGHCCPTGQFWDNEEGQCREATVCYPTPCPFTIEERADYFDHPDCIRPEPVSGQYYEACCNKNLYGEENYYYCKVEAL